MRTLVGLPSTMIVAFCKFTFHLRRVARKECERLFPLNAFLPVMAQTRDTLQNPPFMIADIVYHGKSSIAIKKYGNLIKKFVISLF